MAKKSTVEVIDVPASDKLNKMLAPLRVMHDAMVQIRDTVAKVDVSDDKLKELTLTDLFRFFTTLKLFDDALEEVAKDVGKIKDLLKEVKIPARVEAEGVTTQTFMHGNNKYRVTVAENVRASLPAENRAAGFAWLRAHDLGDLIVETVNASTLSATARTLLEEAKELDPDLFKVAIVPTTSVTKVK